MGHHAHCRGNRHRASALARDQLGEYQAQAAIAALHADARAVEETDWVQIVEWYDELLRFADTPIVRLNRAVAIGEADGAPAGLAALAEVDQHVPRYARSPRTSTRGTAISSSPPASTPTQHETRPTSPNATTRRAKLRDSISACDATIEPPTAVCLIASSNTAWNPVGRRLDRLRGGHDSAFRLRTRLMGARG